MNGIHGLKNMASGGIQGDHNYNYGHNRSLTTAGLGTDTLNAIKAADATNSPLKLFVYAKRKINSIFGEIFDFVNDVSLFSTEIGKSSKFLKAEDVEEIQSFRDKMSAIREVLKRDSMKVAFFGRTSSGKSTVINAMLASKILPSGIGHTTNCFLQIEGSDSNEAYLLVGDSNVKKNVESVSQLGHALCKEKLSENERVTVFWPRDKCLLLRNDVILVDSPGVDVTPNLDEWIDKHCMDADVFVLVANAESTLMVTEKNFFHNVSSKISKPNIFIVHNRWDISETEPEYLTEVRKQHSDRAIDFLTKELKISSPEEAQDRIFFISAKEALQTRLQQSGEPITPSSVEGYHTRYFEFQNFERKFEECISKTAIKTKFEQHFKCGQQIIRKIIEYLDNLSSIALNENMADSKNRSSLIEKINEIEVELKKITRDMKERIQNIAENVEQRVSQALNDEIRRLSNLVEEFHLPFTSDTVVLQHYKHELNVYVERGLGLNLKSKLSNSVNDNITKNQDDMKNRVLGFIPDIYYQDNEYEAFLKRPEHRSFEIFYRLNCSNLCSDFCENLEFKFSWSLITLFQKNFKRFAQLFSSGNRPVNTNLNGSLTNSLNTSNSSASMIQSESFPIIVKSAMLSFGPETSLIVIGVFMKTVGWRVFLIGGFVYSSLYVYERMNWTVKAKERTFKKQYVQHATNKLRLIVDLTSADCSQQVQQELSTTFARLCGLVNDATNKMHDEIAKMDHNLKELKIIAEKCKNLRNKAIYLLNELKEFEQSFLIEKAATSTK